MEEQDCPIQNTSWGREGTQENPCESQQSGQLVFITCISTELSFLRYLCHQGLMPKITFAGHLGPALFVPYFTKLPSQKEMQSVSTSSPKVSMTNQGTDLLTDDAHSEEPMSLLDSLIDHR